MPYVAPSLTSSSAVVSTERDTQRHRSESDSASEPSHTQCNNEPEAASQSSSSGAELALAPEPEPAVVSPSRLLPSEAELLTPRPTSSMSSSSPRDVLVAPKGPGADSGVLDLAAMVDVDAPAPVPITSSTDVDAGIDALSATLSSTHLDNPDHGQRQVPASPPNRSPSPSAPPSLVSDPALSGSSSTSIASLSSSGDASSPPTSAGEAGVGGMDNAHAAPGHGRGHGRHPYGDGADDAVTRYKVGLYAYTESSCGKMVVGSR
jgi:hypothetical protein